MSLQSWALHVLNQGMLLLVMSILHPGIGIRTNIPVRIKLYLPSYGFDNVVSVMNVELIYALLLERMQILSVEVTLI